MRGDRWGKWTFSSDGAARVTALGALCLSALLACGGDRQSAANSTGQAPSGSGAAGQTPPSADNNGAGANDTAAVVSPDTAATPTARRDSTPAPREPGTSVTHQTPPKKAATSKPAAKPKATAPAPKAQPESSTTQAAQSADSPKTAPAEGGTASAPLRDPYHTAPLDTVSQEVYTGWKQFNLNCARCHGEDVQGTTIAPHLIMSLKPDGPINTKELFVQTVCAGRPAKGMPAWCSLGLEMDKIQAIYSYVKGRSDGKIHPGRPAVQGG
jgi:Cytochrome C oxidase, cbb3-type, subunit III